MKKFLVGATTLLMFNASSLVASPFFIEESDTSYVTWSIDASNPLQGDFVLFIFGEQENLSLGSPGSQAWARQHNDDPVAWLPEPENGGWFFRLCDFNQANETCLSYSNEIFTGTTVQPTPPSTSLGLRFDEVSYDYVSWELSDELSDFAGSHVMFMFSENPGIEQNGQGVNHWLRDIQSEQSAYPPPAPSQGGWHYRLCDFDAYSGQCNDYSEEVFAAAEVEEGPDPVSPPGETPPPTHFTLEWLSDGYISWSTSALMGDYVTLLYGDQPDLSFGDSDTRIGYGSTDLRGEQWFDGRYVQLCHFDDSRNTCVASSPVYDSVFPRLDHYPEQLPPMLVPMGQAIRTPSPYDPETTSDNLPITDEERAASLPPLDGFSFADIPNLSPEPGRFYYECGVSHIGYDDPIVFFAQPGMSHLHMFLGNMNTNAFTTTQSLLDTTTPASCRGNRLNRSAYWVPVLYDSHDRAYVPDTSEFMFVNYSTSVNPTNMQVFPEGFRMIAGNGAARAPQEGNFISWSCASSDGNQSSIPACNVGETLIMRLSFPQCWNGVNVDSANQMDHMAYPEYSLEANALVCPASHPVVLPHITFDFRYDVHQELVGPEGNTSDWYLSSDMYDLTNNPGGYSIHGDFMNAWDEVMLQRIVDNCLKIPGNDCNNGAIPGDVNLIQRVRGPQTLNALPEHISLGDAHGHHH